jgi:hypothetical protein
MQILSPCRNKADPRLTSDRQHYASCAPTRLGSDDSHQHWDRSDDGDNDEEWPKYSIRSTWIIISFPGLHVYVIAVDRSNSPKLLKLNIGICTSRNRDGNFKNRIVILFTKERQ